ncbi:MAG: hypothetical protein JWO82_3109, partial [Akkermansiaceae bacterium]|nr:hypothetical protein [Akkermansiaceae bacterium]
WRNGKDRTDIDLSGAFFDEAFNYVDVISYYNLRNSMGHHSGDIVDAPKGAAEFFDLDLDAARKKGVRYVVMSVNSFTAQPYCDLPECFAGWMGRAKPDSGEIFEARTVLNKVDLTANTRTCLPAIFDIEARQVIWADVALAGSPYWNNVANNLSGVALMLRALLSLEKPTLEMLFRLHVRARGIPVASREEAKVVFSPDAGVTPFDIPMILAEYL